MTRAQAITPLNRPRQLSVTPDLGGAPARVRLPEGWVDVAAVLDTWRIDDEWWRDEISRRYWHVELADGRPLTVFEDLVSGGWYAQRYKREPTIVVR